MEKIRIMRNILQIQENKRQTGWTMRDTRLAEVLLELANGDQWDEIREVIRSAKPQEVESRLRVYLAESRTVSLGSPRSDGCDPGERPDPGEEMGPH